ncbi:MAG: AAA family ATPase [Rhodobacteraceae bacterium]|nr:AAA family ATPase [Paracoccaceae bacterium]MYF46418.1 AAA family ATPase [Paracoccaceae bacterium]MYI90438.1 AAA family ATPase [Paracoccaceae bacterium]
MKESNSKKNLELEVKDFGPVSEAKISLKPMTVFIGSSNTGKSYLAVLIYALHKVFNLTHPYRFFSLSKRIHNDENLLLSFQKLASRAQVKESSLPEMGIEIPSAILDEIKNLISLQGYNLRQEIVRSFGIKDIKELIRFGTSRCSMVKFGIANEPDAIIHKFKIGTKESNFESRIPETFKLLFSKEGYQFYDNCNSILTELNKFKEEERKKYTVLTAPSIDDMLWRLHLYHYPITLGPLSSPAYYLPTDRAGVLHTYRLVLSSLIKGASLANQRPEWHSPMVSGVLADFLDNLVGIDGTSNGGKKSNLINQAKQIERNLIQGEIKVTRSELANYPHFKYHPEGWKSGLSLLNASSMVSELAPLVLYLRHVVEPGNVLIVEEPESHLHPAKQVEFTRQLAELVNKGLKVIITTHSEWILEELGNIVQRSKIKSWNGKPQNAVGISLSPDQVGAWLFKSKKRPRGSFVEEIKLDEETGLYPSGFDAVSESLYNDSVNIYNRIHK